MKTPHNPLIRFLEIARHFILVGAPLGVFSILTVIGATKVRAGADVDYVLTAPTDPVKPGHVAEFQVTARNLTGGLLSATVHFTVPNFTTYDANGHSGGSDESISFSNIPIGGSRTGKLLFHVLGGNMAPPDGTPIPLTLTDQIHGITTPTRTIFVMATPALNVQLSTEQGTVIPGGLFTYTIRSSNVSTAARNNVTLSVPLPAGATFISADGPSGFSNNVVTWDLQSLGANANRQVHVTFQASATANTPLGSVDATLSDGVEQAQASDSRAVYTTPEFEYTITSPTDPVLPGHVAEFDVTVHNVSGSLASAGLYFTVPESTTYVANGHPAGSLDSVSFSNVPDGTSRTAKLLFAVPGGNMSPPSGTTITLNVTDINRGGSVSRSIVVRPVQMLNLQLSTEQGTIPPGGTVTYTLTSANLSGSNRSSVTLSVPVPAGTSFVSADGPSSFSNGIVSWAFQTLSSGSNRQVHVTFQASNSPNNPLVLLNAILTDSNGDIARVSDTRAVYAAPTFDYIITSPTDPVRPNHIAEFDITVRNLSGAMDSAGIYFTVPEFTTYVANGHPAGSLDSVSFSNVPDGTSRTAKLYFLVPSNLTPPDGGTITLNAIDINRAASVSRSIVIRPAQTFNLQLSTQPGTVPVGGQFTYTLSASNVTAGTLNGVTLSVPLPAGATFIHADSPGGISNNIVTWNLASLIRGAVRQVHVIFQASATANTPLGPIDATLSDSNAHVARASDNRVIYDTPTFEYSISSPTDPVIAGQTAEFDITVSNVSGATSTAAIYFTVPEFTTYVANGHPAGSLDSVSFSNVPDGTSRTIKLFFAVPGGNMAPPNGTLITLDAVDGNRGASVSKTIKVHGIDAPKADFNADARPDWILQIPSTRQTQIWLMNNGVLSSSFVGPTLPVHWALIDADQFNATNSSDLVLFNSTTRQTAIWYMNGARYLSGAAGPTLPVGWVLVLSHDFNNDGKPDFLLYNGSTHQTAVWYLNGTAVSSTALGPTLPVGWFVFGVADFNLDGYPDLLIWNPSRRSSGIWYLTNLTFSGSGYGPAFAPGWVPAALDDFNRDGHPDLALANPSTHQTAIWYLNNNVRFSSRFGPNTPAGFYLTAPR